MEGYKVNGAISIAFPSGTFTFKMDNLNAKEAIELIDLIRSSLALGATMKIEESEAQSS